MVVMISASKEILLSNGANRNPNDLI